MGHVTCPCGQQSPATGQQRLPGSGAAMAGELVGAGSVGPMKLNSSIAYCQRPDKVTFLMVLYSGERK
jgi:hypothetical protein